MIKVDQKLQNFHLRLSHGSATLIIGSIPGVLKALSGLVEIAVSLLFAALLLLPSLLSKKARGLFIWSGTHVGHGFKRTLVGAWLSIPFAGTVTVPCAYGVDFCAKSAICCMSFGVSSIEGFLNSGDVLEGVGQGIGKGLPIAVGVNATFSVPRFILG